MELGDRIRTALGGLIRRKLAREAEMVQSDALWRKDGDKCIGLVITDAGRAALANAIPVVEAVSSVSGPPISKTAMVLTMLSRPEGASLTDLMSATGWLPHSVRGALSGLRKKGHAVVRSSVDGNSCWRLSEQS